MTAGTLDRLKLPELLAALGEDAVVYAPVTVEAEVDLEVVAARGAATPAMDRLALDYGLARRPAKRLFFPQTETMLRYRDAVLTDSAAGEPAPEIVAFGVRPCDAQALLYLDKVFGAGPTATGDPYYARRRERSLIIASACSEPRSSCFCSALGGDPAGTRGADLLVTTLADRLHFRAVSPRGQEALERRSTFFSRATAAETAAAEASHNRARDLVRPLSTRDTRVEPGALKAALDSRFADPIWDRLTQSCIGCGACTYLCPTCHCFDIVDEDRMHQGRRIRTWDSCQYGTFTRHASGHNPRPTRKSRMRQRFMHKFSYALESSGEVFCVGCGRCVSRCPVNLDIRDVIRAFSETGA